MDAKHITHYYNYTVRSGDSLSRIIFKMYGYAPTDTRYRKSMDYVLSLNPEIKNPNLILPGQVIHLGVISELKVEPKPVNTLSLNQVATFASPKRLFNSTTKQIPIEDAGYFWALSWLDHNYDSLVIPGSIAAGATSNLLSAGNTALITQISDLYAQYKIREITQNQYNYQRKLKLDQLKTNLGPAEKWLFGGKTTHQSIRIARGGGVPATTNIANNAERLNRLAKVAKGGGIVLTGVGVSASCMQIANAIEIEEKNDILVETVASTSVGLGVGTVVGLFLVSNPIGWGTAIVLAVGTAAVSYGTGKAVRYAYEASGRKVDFVTGTGIDKVCR